MTHADRRTLIKGIALGAGAAFLRPFLDGLAAEAAGEAPPPRFIFMFENNGLWAHHVRPKNLGAKGDEKGEKLVDLPLADLELPEPIAPLAPLKDRMSILMNLSGAQCAPNHGAAYGALGCYNARTQGTNTQFADPRMQTVDHVLAKSLPGIFPVVGLGIHANPEVVFANSVSVVDPKRPLTMMCQPHVAFQTLFGSVAEGRAGKAYAARNKFLDWARSDISRVRNELPAMDREKLDRYLDAFEQMRSRQDKVVTVKDNLKANQPATDKFDSKLKTERFEAQCALTVAALASRLTNVVVLDAACGPHGYKVWSELGVNVDGHEIGHMVGSPQREPLNTVIRQFHAKRVVDLADRLAAIKEGNGTLLDNTVIVWLSDSAEEHHGMGEQWPMIVVGDLGGRLKTAGRYLQYPRYKQPGNRTTANLYMSFLHAVGDKRETFGDPDKALADFDTRGPLAEILA